MVTLLQFKYFKITKRFQEYSVELSCWKWKHNASFPILPYMTAKAHLNHGWHR